jgi:sugar lactone lactonase YvrE
MKKITTFIFLAGLLIGKSQTVTTIAGNGTGANLLNEPRGIVFQRSTGDIYFTDISNNQIKKISAINASVTLYAGIGAVGNTNGALGSCVLNRAAGICIDNAGTTMYISESGGNYIKKIDMVANTISIFAGNGSGGSANGTGTLSSFNTPTDIDIDNNGNLYVADYGNNKIRKITPSGVVSDLAIGISAPHGVAVDKVTGTIYTAGRYDNKVYKITPNGTLIHIAGKNLGGSADGVGLTSSTFASPMDVDADMNGNLYIAEAGGRIRRIKISDTTVTTLVGKNAMGTQFNDGKADTVLINFCTGVAAKDTTTLFLTATTGNVVKKYSKPTVASTTGIKTHITEADLNVFPNPANSILTVQLPTNYTAAKIEVYDVNGKQVLEEKLNIDQNSFSVSELKSGFYYLVLQSENSTYKAKFIKE